MWIAAVLSLIFVLLSTLHWYWACGGKSGKTIAVPEVKGKPAFDPGPLATSGVAVLLLIAAVICAAQGELAGLSSSRLSRVGLWVLAVLFFVRAVGDFRLVGAFKRIRDTQFARMDTYVFAPLCVLISMLCGVLLYLTS